MHPQLKRSIPLTTTAAALTFGGCVGSELENPPPTDEELTTVAREFARAACEIQVCVAEDPEEDFQSIEECLEFYDYYYVPSTFADLAADAPDPDGCRVALESYFECMADYYFGLSCQELPADFVLPLGITPGCEAEDQGALSRCGWE